MNKFPSFTERSSRTAPRHALLESFLQNLQMEQNNNISLVVTIVIDNAFNHNLRARPQYDTIDDNICHGSLHSTSSSSSSSSSSSLLPLSSSRTARRRMRTALMGPPPPLQPPPDRWESPRTVIQPKRPRRQTSLESDD